MRHESTGVLLSLTTIPYKLAKTAATKSKAKVMKETPLMKQYNQIKTRHPQALLLFRVGDFYETFGEDAITASKILGIVSDQ